MAFDCDMGDRGCLPSITPASVRSEVQTNGICSAPPAYRGSIPQQVSSGSEQPPAYNKQLNCDNDEPPPVKNLNLMDEMNEDSDDTKLAFNALRAANVQLHSTLTEATEALEILQQENEEERQLNDQLTKQNSHLLEQISSCNQSITDESVREQLDVLVTQLSTATSENTTLRSTHATEIRTLAEQNQQLTTKIKSLSNNEEKNEELNREISFLRKSIADSDSKNKTAPTITDEILHKNETLTTQVLALTRYVEDTQKDYEKVVEKNKILTEQISTLSTHVEELSTTTDSEASIVINQINEIIKQGNLIQTTTNKDLPEQISLLVNRVSDIDQNRDSQMEHQVTVKELEKEISRLSGCVNKDSKPTERLKVENNHLRRQLGALTDSKEKEIYFLDQLQSEITSLRHQLQQSNSDLTTAEAEIVDVRAKLSRCQKCNHLPQTTKPRHEISSNLTSSEEDLLQQAEQQLTICSDYLSINDGFDMRD